MRLSIKSEYACLALSDLSERYGEGFIKVEHISTRWKIPRKFLEQIMFSLKVAGYVKSKRGANGGYCLSRPPDAITLAEIIRLFDGALAPVASASTHFYDSTPIEQHKQLLGVFTDIRNTVAEKLEARSFADITIKSSGEVHAAHFRT